mmetsp:Transcript_40631/g.67496  ORF Transcript_40631/g.67496 Transcript_40631/m.67496 type:complete len:84 (+) Transcript_40631:70-321(+)
MYARRYKDPLVDLQMTGATMHTSLKRQIVSIAHQKPTLHSRKYIKYLSFIDPLDGRQRSHAQDKPVASIACHAAERRRQSAAA